MSGKSYYPLAIKHGLLEKNSPFGSMILLLEMPKKIGDIPIAIFDETGG